MFEITIKRLTILTL